jgi:LysM repeat protein
MNTIKEVEKRLSVILAMCLFMTVVGVLNAGAQTSSAKIIIEGKTYYLYKVKKSEGLFRISQTFGVTQKEILDVNPEIQTGLKEGQLIRIPVISGRNATNDEIADSGDFIYHTVEKGHTIFFISRKYQVPVSTIYEYNPGSDSKLLEGSILKLPRTKISSTTTKVLSDQYVLHKVKPQETLYGLAKTYGVSQSEIIKANPALKDGVLPLGSEIRIPKRSSENRQNTELQWPDKEEKVLEDDSYHYHQLKAGETLYSLSKAYGVNLKALEAANASINRDDLPIGYLIRIPKSAINKQKAVYSEDDFFIVHAVKRKETLFAISRHYNVDVTILKQVNSSVNFSKLKRGTAVKIPTQKWFEEYYKQEQKETQIEEVPTHSVDEVIKLAECHSYNYYSGRPTLKVGLLLPFNVDESRKVNVITRTEEGEEIEVEREEKIISNKSKVFVEFYEGVLMALDSLKKQDTDVDLFVYDTHNDSIDKIRGILERPELPFLDMIIGPAFTENLKPVADFAKAHDIKLVYPFSTRNSELFMNANVFQVSPVDTLLLEPMVDQIVRDAGGKRVILIRTATKSDYEEKLSQKIREKIYWNSFLSGEQPNYAEYEYETSNLTGLEGLFDAHLENMVIIPSNEEAPVSAIVTTLAGVVTNNKLTASLWGFPEWLRFQSLKPVDIHRLNTRVFSYYHLDYTKPVTNSFVQKYRSWYKTEPIAISPYFQKASVRSNFSRYGIWGYDVTLYFVGALKKYGPHFEYCLDDYHPELLQSNFRFKRVSNWGGLYNMGLFILNFTPDYQLFHFELH